MSRTTSLKHNINNFLLIVARESRGFTQKELATKINVTQGWLSKLESGFQCNVSEDVLADIANVLNYPVEFFLQEDRVYGFGPTELFNRRKTISTKKIQSIHAQLNIRRIHLNKMLRGVNIAEPNFPQYSTSETTISVEKIAELVRSSWHIPPGPVINLVQLLEDHGGIVIPFDFDTPKIDAMSILVPGTPPLFFINPASPPDRLRFTLSHELGHIVMHYQYPNENMENEADRFAAQFLMPDKEIKPLLRDLSFAKLPELKIYWQVSMQAIIKRAYDLKTITQKEYRSLYVKLSSAGYRSNEPYNSELPPENPTLYREIVDVYQNDLGYSLSEFSKLICYNEAETEKFYYYYPNNKLRLICK